MAELATVERAAVVVEERYGAVFKAEYVSLGFLADLLGALQVRYPQGADRLLRYPTIGRGVDIPFPGRRPLARSAPGSPCGRAAPGGEVETVGRISRTNSMVKTVEDTLAS